MVQGKCRTCGETITGRKSKNASANANFLKNVRKHYKKKHPKTIGRRISKSLRNRDQNPSIQDLASALSTGVRAGIEIIKDWTEREYRTTKVFMDAMEPFLEPQVVIAWKAVEAYHDAMEN